MKPPEESDWGIDDALDSKWEKGTGEEYKFSSSSRRAPPFPDSSSIGFGPLPFPNRTSREIFNELMLAVAKEESAISHLIHAEADKIYAFTGKKGNFPHSPTAHQVSEFQHSVSRVIEALVEKQKLLIRMVEMSKRLLDEQGRAPYE